MVGNTPDLVTPTKVEASATVHTHVKGRTIYIPLEFWFNRNPGLALPLIALKNNHKMSHKDISTAGQESIISMMKNNLLTHFLQHDHQEQKKNTKMMMLVAMTLRQSQIAGKPFPLLFQKPQQQDDKNKVIRSQAFLLPQTKEEERKVQRLNGSGFLERGLRYSLL
jgi:hypothetical protein